MTNIVVKSSDSLRKVVPSSVWRQGKFVWRPMEFVCESEKLKDKMISASTQEQGLTSFLKDPRQPLLYGVSGNPDDAQAKYFAAYLVSKHIEALGVKASVQWHVLYGGFAQSTVLRSHSDLEERKPTLLVLSNLTLDSTNIKLEKARDLIEHYDDVPVVVVSAGSDPISFFSTRLNLPINALAYFSSSLIKKRVEVI